ncbi:MAG: TolC family protein [Selenomonadaceae bacterium]|nr:TolC family protein [Selenomonadaceae bacterium]
MKKSLAKKILATFSIFFAANFSAVEAAVPLTLNESIHLALTNDEQIASALAATKSARWNLSSARRATGPSLGWSSNALKIGGRDYRGYNDRHNAYGNEGRYVYYYDEFNDRIARDYISGSTAYNNTFTNTFSLEMPLYTGGRAENTIKSRGYQLNAADLTLENTKQTIRYQTIAAYYEVLQQHNLLNIAESAVRMATEQLNIIQIQFEEGVVAKSDVLQMQVQLSNYRQSLVSTQGNLEVANATLLNTIGLPEETEFDATDNFSYSPFPFTLDECLAYALENRPDGAAALYQVRQAEAQADAAKAGDRPSVTGVASKYIAANGAFQQERSANWQIGVRLNWSFFDNNVTKANVNAAKASVESAQANFERVEKNIRLQVRSAYTQMKAAEENIRSTAAAVSQAEESSVIARVRYEEGVDILLTVTNAQEKLNQARTNYFTALYQYNLYKAQLEKAIGIPVDINTPIYMENVREGRYSNDALEAAALHPNVSETFEVK